MTLPCILGDFGTFHLTHKEERVMLVLLDMKHHGWKELAEAVWKGHAPETAQFCISNYIASLRAKIGPYLQIYTHMHVGYLLVETDRED